MIRVVSLVYVILIATLLVTGLYLSHQVDMTEARIVHLNRQIALERQRIHHLEGAWSLVTSPDNLRPVVELHTAMIPATGAHVVTLAAIPYPVITLPEGLGGLGDGPSTLSVLMPPPPVKPLVPGHAPGAITAGMVVGQ